MDSHQTVNPPAPEQRQIPLRDVVINNDSIAINIMAFMLDLAHKRGAYNFEEAAKIHECMTYLGNQSRSPLAPGIPLPPVLEKNEREEEEEEDESDTTKNNVTLQVSETN